MDLIVTMDDATSEIYSMFLVEEEGTASTFLGLREVIGERGLFCSLYTDRGSHYFYTPKAGEKVSKTQQTQVGRALSHLGIEHIAAYSPQARGRSERMFGTLQGRLPKDLRLGRDHDSRSCQRVAEDALHRRAQPGLCDQSRTGRNRVRRGSSRSLARGAVRDRGTDRRQ